MPSISNWLVRGSFWSLVLGLSCGVAAPGLAAKTVTILDGTNPVEVADLEKLAKTGQLSLSLLDWEEVLSINTNNNGESISLILQKQLNQTIIIDPNNPQSVAKLGKELKTFLESLQPGITDAEIQEVATLIAQKANNLTVMDLLTKLPVDNLTAGNFIDALKKMPPPPKTPSTTNILYLNSTRGYGTASYGNFRSTIANTLENYQGGTVFDVDFVQTHVPGSVGLWLNSKPVGFYNQIWFDTTIYQTTVLDTVDFAAINAWAANKQPEFILDSSFFARNKETTTVTPSAAAITINQALALKNAGGGILIGTDHNDFAYTANQILTNFGFDGLFTGVDNISANGSFVGNLLLNPQPVGADFFVNNLQGLSTSHVPVGTHTLNANGGDRTIKIIENLFSYSPNKVVHIGASFDTGNHMTPIDDPESVPEPTTVLGTLAFGAVVTRWRVKRKQQQKSLNSTVS